MTVQLLTEYHLEFLSLKEGCTGTSESTLVKMPHCWKSHYQQIRKEKDVYLVWHLLYACSHALDFFYFVVYLTDAVVV